MKRSEIMLSVAAKAAARYASRVWWADIADLRQEAVVACLDAVRTFDPECGVPLGGYLWRSCMLHLRNYCWRQSAPVSETHHHLADLRGVHRASLDEVAHTEDAAASPFDSTYEREWGALVDAQIDHLLRQLGRHELVARCVLNLKWSASEVAKAFDVPIGDVYCGTKMGKRKLADNAMLYDLLREKRG